MFGVLERSVRLGKTEFLPLVKPDFKKVSRHGGKKGVRKDL